MIPPPTPSAWIVVWQPVPAPLYQAVAEILAFVYRTHRYYFHQLRQRRAMAGPSA